MKIVTIKKLEIMRKVLIMAALFLGTTAMVNAQTTPAKTETPKEVKHAKHAKHAKKKAEKTTMKAEATTVTAAAKTETPKAKK